MRAIVFDGTPAEVSEALQRLNIQAAKPISDSAGPVTATEAPTPGGIDDDQGDGADSPVSLAMARLILSRRKLTKEQRLVVSAIYKAHPGTLLATELQALIGYTPAQFAGLMGAFGRRISHTEGYIDGTWFFDQEWDYEEGCNRYSFPEPVREAVRLERLF